MIDDGKHMKITHNGSINIPSSLNSFYFDIFCVSGMKNNLISIFKLYSSIKISIGFLPSSFIVKNLNIWTYPMDELNKNRVYEWSIVTLSSSKFIFAQFQQ